MAQAAADKARVVRRVKLESVGLHPLVALIQLLRSDHVANDPQRTQLPLQRKTKPTRFINCVHFCAAFLFESGRPMEERFFRKTLRRLRVAPPSCITTT
jgi:hypothetical protein